VTYKRISHYMVAAFIGGLGLFNSTKLELRQVTASNQELIFQNGQIMSSALIILSIAGIFAEFVILYKQKKEEKLTLKRAGKSTTIINHNMPRWMSNKKNGNFVLTEVEKPTANPEYSEDKVDNSEIEFGVSVENSNNFTTEKSFEDPVDDAI